MAELIDLTGKRFGKLVVLSKGESRRTSGGQFKATWICKCDCGNTTTVDAEKLRNGRTRSCGCAFSEVVSQKKRKDITEHIIMTNYIEYIEGYRECLDKGMTIIGRLS